MEDFIRFLYYGGTWGGLLGIAAFIFLLGILKSFIKVTLPDNILVITGRKKAVTSRTFGFSVERGRTVLVPYFQTVQKLDLGVFPINVRVDAVNSANGITVGADATACVCINDDDEGMLYSAVERLMGKDRKQISQQIQATLIGNFRGALNKATPLQAIGMEESLELTTDTEEAGKAIDSGERAHFRNELLRDINSDLSNFGMKVVSVSLQKIWDTSNYIANLAQKTLAQKRQAVLIEETRLHAIANQAESDCERRVSVAANQANEKILTAREKLEVYRRESQGQIEQARLEADNAIQEAKNKGERLVQEQLVELQKLKNMSEITLIEESKREAAAILAEGQNGAINIREETKNTILKQKVSLVSHSGAAGRAVLFMQQQLPHLFERFKEHAEGMKVDSLVIMDEKTGFNGAVNRGPAAFADFLEYLSKALGVNVKALLNTEGEKR